MNEELELVCDSTTVSKRSTVSERLSRRRAELSGELKRVEEAIDALRQQPGVEDLLNKLAKLGF